MVATHGNSEDLEEIIGEVNIHQAADEAGNEESVQIEAALMQQAEQPSAQQGREKAKWASSPTDKTLMCKFFLRQRCVRKDCNFAHSEAEQRAACKKIVCRFELQGSCRQGKDCWYSHASNEATSESSTAVATDCEGTSNDCVKIVTKLRPKTLSDHTWEVRAAQKAKVQLCKFWLKNNCQQENCRFAHGLEEQRAAYGRIKCRFYMQGRCSKGARCCFLHPADANVARKGSEASSQAGSAVATSAPSSMSDVDLSDSDDEFLAGIEQQVNSPREVSAPASNRLRTESWADFSESDDEFIPRAHVRRGVAATA